MNHSYRPWSTLGWLVATLFLCLVILHQIASLTRPWCRVAFLEVPLKDLSVDILLAGSLYYGQVVCTIFKKSVSIRIWTGGGIYGQIYPFALRSSQGRRKISLHKLFQSKLKVGTQNPPKKNYFDSFVPKLKAKGFQNTLDLHHDQRIWGRNDFANLDNAVFLPQKMNFLLYIWT